jgi:hypothetical protein
MNILIEGGIEMRIVLRLLFSLHVLVGMGAIAGGMAAFMNPNEPLGITVEALKHSPFKNYLIPGIILFTVIGIGNIVSSLFLMSRSKFQGYVSSFFSWALIIWIVVQCIMLNEVDFLHILFFIIGLIQAVLSMIILFEQSLFPANLIKNIYKRLKSNAM